MSEFLVWRQVICPFDRDRRILQYLVTTPVFSEDGQYLLSSLVFSCLYKMRDCHVMSGTRRKNILNSTLFLKSFFIFAELHLASYESEGPENNMEKDSRRSLR